MTEPNLDKEIDLLFGLSDGFTEWFKPAVKEFIANQVEEAYRKGQFDESKAMKASLRGVKLAKGGEK